MYRTLAGRVAPPLVALLLAGGMATPSARAGPWDEGPERLVFELGVTGLTGTDLDERQLGGGFGVRLQAWGPLTLELMAFVVPAAGDSADRAGGDAVDGGYLLAGLVPGVGVDIGRGLETFGVALFCRPPVIWVIPNDGPSRVRTPRLGRRIPRMPNVTLLMGDQRYWLEIGGGGDPTPLEPRVAHAVYQWRTARGGGGALGVALFAIVDGAGAVRTPDWPVGVHLSGWIPLGHGVTMGLRADLAGLVSVGVSFAYHLGLR